MSSTAALSRLQEVLAARKIPLRVASADRELVGSFDLKREETLLEVEVYRKKQPPHAFYLLAPTLGNEGAEQRHMGRSLIIELFDIADQARIAEVVAEMSDIGRYASASYHIQCKGNYWRQLQNDLLANLKDYCTDKSVSADTQTARQEQAKHVSPIITGSNGALGLIVDALREEPLIDPKDSPFPHLGKLLFLTNKERCCYDGYWNYDMRRKARERFFQATRPAAPQSSRNPFTPGA